MAQGVLAVLGLVAGLGVFNENLLFLAGVGVGVLVAQTHARFHLVYVLTACTAASEGVPRHQCRFHFHLDCVVDQRCHKHRCERGHALALGIVGRHAHQAVHAVLAFEIAVGEITLDIDGARFYAGLVPLENVGNRGFVAMFLAVAQIHAHEHRGPVLALGAACAGVDFEHHAHVVLLATEHVAQLERLGLFECGSIELIKFLLGDEFLLIEIPAVLQLFGGGSHLLVAVDPGLEIFDFLHLRLSLLGVLPEVGHMSAEFLLFDLDFLAVDVEIFLERGGALENLLELFLCDHLYAV